LLAIIAIMCSGASFSKPACNETASSSAKSYSRAADRITLLPETLAWQRTHSHPIVLGLPTDRQVLIEKSCFWEVSVYANRSERLELWNTFLVPTQNRPLMIRDSEGKAIAFKQWKKRAKSQT
jgi:hypothetical protein